MAERHAERGYAYFDDPRAPAVPLTRDEARRIAANMVKLPSVPRLIQGHSETAELGQPG